MRTLATLAIAAVFVAVGFGIMAGIIWVSTHVPLWAISIGFFSVIFGIPAYFAAESIIDDHWPRRGKDGDDAN
jgi:hypothetical protein